MYDNVKFEWDSHKAELNVAKHGLTFLDGIQVFRDFNLSIERDDRSDYGEDRYIATGHIKQRLCDCLC